MFVAKVKNFIRANGLISTGDSVLAAVSGGPDSVALVNALVALRSELGFRLSAAHVNHGLRVEAPEEEQFVLALCERLGLRCVVGRVDTRAFAAQCRSSLEEAARELRHGFLAEQAKGTPGRPKVALGHTLDDQAETVLMRLIRGAGVRGLSAMRPFSEAMFIRPLLSSTRQEVLEFLKSREISYVEDASNLDLTFLRNRVRHELLALLRDRYNPRIVEVLGSQAALLDEADDYLTLSAREACEKCVSAESADCIELELPRLLSYHVCVQGYVFREAYFRLCGTLRDVGFSHIAALAKLVSSGRSGDSVDLPRGVAAMLEGTALLFGPRSVLRSEEAGVCEFSVQHEPGSRTWLSGFSLGVESQVLRKEDLKKDPDVTPAGPGPSRGVSPGARSRGDSSSDSVSPFSRTEERSEVFFDLGVLSPPLVLRNLRPGDRISPFGMEGSKKIQDLLVDMKVPRHARRRLVALCDRNEMLWLVGVRRGSAAPVEENTELVLAVRTFAAA